jgi:hypothetical protein
MTIKFWRFLVLVFLLAGCSTPTTEQVTPILPQIAAPVTGKATVTGKVMDVTNGNEPMADTLLRLAKIYGEGEEAIYALNESDSPGIYTDKDGVFIFENIDPGPYTLLFTDSNGNYRTILESSEKIISIDANVDEISDFGVIRVDTSNPGP